MADAKDTRGRAGVGASWLNRLRRLLISAVLIFAVLGAVEYLWWRTWEYAQGVVAWLASDARLDNLRTGAPPRHRSLP